MENFITDLLQKFTAKCVGERILKIDQRLAKLATRLVGRVWHIFSGHSVYRSLIDAYMTFLCWCNALVLFCLFLIMTYLSDDNV